MANRIIKESIRFSEKVNKMTDFQFRLWVSLITYVDDYGRGDARPELIKGLCFPLRRVTVADILTALHKLADIGCISLYEVDGQSYLCLPNWESHQNIRTKKSKYPAPPEEKQNPPQDKQKSKQSVSDSQFSQQSESNCNNLNQLVTDCNKLQQIESDCNKMLLESNPNPNPKSNPNPNILHGAPQAGASVPDEAAVEAVVLNTGEEWRPTIEQYGAYARLYPGVDIAQEFRKMRGWCDANPKKRKTRTGVLRFVNSWLSRAQDSQKPNKQTGSAYMDAIANRVSAVDDWLERMRAKEGESDS